MQRPALDTAYRIQFIGARLTFTGDPEAAVPRVADVLVERPVHDVPTTLSSTNGVVKLA